MNAPCVTSISLRVGMWSIWREHAKVKFEIAGAASRGWLVARRRDGALPRSAGRGRRRYRGGHAHVTLRWNVATAMAQSEKTGTG
jgi:hypothetical protein